METGSRSSQAKTNYLNADYSVKSWLLTTDHKRVAVLYLISITLFVILGGFFAILIRLNLLTPAGDLVLADTYNKLFTMHGIVMIFLFLLLSGPAVFGSFLVPMMIGANGLAFPKLNLASWYIFIVGAGFIFCAIITGWSRYGLDLLHAMLEHILEYECGLSGVGRVNHRALIDPDRIEHHRYGAPDAGAGADLAAGCRYSSGLTMRLRSSWC